MYNIYIYITCVCIILIMLFLIANNRMFSVLLASDTFQTWMKQEMADCKPAAHSEEQ